MEKEYINIEPIKVQDEELKLVFINPVGETHNGQSGGCAIPTWRSNYRCGYRARFTWCAAGDLLS
jgi:hypothetical protein